MTTTRLSIIIPFYGVEQFIGHCLDSVYRQDIPENEYEVICVDDCSPDNSLSIVESYAFNHSNLKIVKNKENRRLGGARNAGVEMATGNFIWFIDSDDFIEENVLGTLCSIAERDNLDVLHFDYENYPVRTPLRKIKYQDLMSGPELFFGKGFKWYHSLVTAWRKLYKKSFLIENHISFAEHIMFEDSDYAIMVFARAQRVRHIDLVAYDYRINPDSITRTEYNSNHIYYWLELCNRMLNLKAELLSDGSDKRFQPVIDRFVKNGMRHIFDSFHSLNKKEKRIARRIINDRKYSPLREYTSRKDYYKFKLGMR